MREKKNSGIEWIGDIPSEWNLKRNKVVFSCSKEVVGNNSANTQLLSLTTRGVKLKSQDTLGGKTPESFDTYQYVNKDDIIMCLFDLDCSAVFSGISPYDGMISPAYKILKCRESVYPQYADYWFSFVFIDRKFKSYAKNLRYTLNYDEFADLLMICPSYAEQKKIAGFLDEKCVEIDTVIEKTKATIEEYRKLKQSVITQAVTKGIRPNRPMKDSGIEWIGEVPADWNVVKASRLVVSTQNGLSRRDLEKSDGQIVLKLKNISPDGKISYSEINRIELTNKEIETYSLEDGDFLFVRVNGSKNLVGKCAIYKDISEIVAYNDHIIRVRLNEICNKRYFQYYLQSSSGKTEIDLHTSTAAGQFTISGEGLRDLYIVLPLNDEQNELADYLDKKCSEIDELIAKKTSLLSELEGYKKSLIYEYVTGKKEV